jgi:hypothetical protein
MQWTGLVALAGFAVAVVAMLLVTQTKERVSKLIIWVFGLEP